MVPIRIEALLLGIRHPAKVKKIVAIAVNPNPSDKALRPDVLDLIRQSMAAIVVFFSPCSCRGSSTRFLRI
jgi:hypothetical protein